MSLPKRDRIEPTDDWQQRELLVHSPGQRTYELIRPVVLFGQPPAERAAATGTAARTVYRHVARFAEHGLAGLEPPPRIARHHRLSAELRQAIIDLKREHPPLNTHEITTICWARFGQRPSSPTVKRILAEQPPPPRTTRRFSPYQQITDPAERRLAIIRLHSEGWNKQSIAAYLETSRVTVHETLKRWVAEGVAGLDDRSSAPKQPAHKATLRAIATVKERQENPELGGWRVHAALQRAGIILSPRTCGRILARNRKLYGLPKPTAPPKVPRPMPFAARHRQHIWSVDIRYLDHRLGDGTVSCSSVLDNDSRAIRASGLSRTQDRTAYLLVLDMAIRQHGAPEVLVSDSGGVFLAKQAQASDAALGIAKRAIARRQPWQHYLETTFNVQRRMADWDFARAMTWADLLAIHDQWVAEYNDQDHWAHRKRDDGERSPGPILGWVRGRVFREHELQRVFSATRSGRTLDRAGSGRFRRWRLYAERGLRGAAVAVWLYGERRTLACSDEPVAQYTVTYQPDKRHLRTVTAARRFETPHRSPQPPLWAWGDGEWLTVLRLPDYAPRTVRTGGARQLPLFVAADVG